VIQKICVTVESIRGDLLTVITGDLPEHIIKEVVRLLKAEVEKQTREEGLVERVYWNTTPQHTVMPSSPGGYEKGTLYKIPPRQAKMPWWREVSQNDHNRWNMEKMQLEAAERQRKATK